MHPVNRISSYLQHIIPPTALAEYSSAPIYKTKKVSAL
jgi:hypothetical protein